LFYIKKKRRQNILCQRLSRLEQDRSQGRVHLCFGGKKLFRAQFHLEKNGFSTHAQWKEAWDAKRNSEFFVIGSKDETAGNQTCVATQKNGALSLRLRLPRVLEERFGKFLEIENVCFAYGQQTILANLNHPAGEAISYRFKKDGKSWRVFASTAFKKVPTISKENSGVIGLDLNVDHIAYVETERFGNPIQKKKTLPGQLMEKIKTN